MGTETANEDGARILSGHALQAVELDWYASDEKVRVTPRNQQRFDISKDRAIEILQVAEERRERFEKQFSLLLTTLAEWVHKRAEKVETPYLTIQDASFLFVVVQKTAELDLAFEDELSALDFQIANDSAFDLLQLHAISLPPVEDESLRSFVFEPFVLSYHGHREGSSQSGE